MPGVGISLMDAAVEYRGGSSPPPPPPPVWLPQAPSGDYPSAYAGPKDNHWWDGSTAGTVADVWTQNTDWGSFDAGTDIVGGSGLESKALGTAPVLTSAAAADLLSGYTAVVSVAITTDVLGRYNLDCELLDLPGYVSEWWLQLFFDQTGTPPGSSSLAAVDGANGTEFKDIDDVQTAGAHKIAFTLIAGQKLSMSVDGGEIVQTDAAAPANSEAFTNVVLTWRNYAGAASYVTSASYFTPQPNADLPTLSAP